MNMPDIPLGPSGAASAEPTAIDGPLKIGIVGGMGWMATRLYYSELCRLSAKRMTTPGQTSYCGSMDIAIESLDLEKARAPGNDGSEQLWSAFDAYIRDALERLATSGVQLALIASNTPHERFHSITKGICIPVINLFDAMARYCWDRGYRRVLVLGTETTMQSRALQESMRRAAIQAAAPAEQHSLSAIQSLIHSIQAEGPHDLHRAQLASIVALEKGSAVFDAVLLACTDLPLAFPEEDCLPEILHEGVIYVSSPIVHVMEGVRRAFRQFH